MKPFASDLRTLSKTLDGGRPRLELSTLRFSLLALLVLLVSAHPTLSQRAAAQEAPPRAPSEGTGLERQDEGDNVTVVLDGDVRQRFPLAFPATEIAAGASSKARAAAEELDDALRHDLELTRVFDIQGPQALSVLELSGDPSLDLEQYRSLGNEILLLAEIEESGGRLIFNGRLLDLANGESIVGKRYQGDFAIARAIAHTFSDEVLLYLSGRRGIARTSIAFVSDRSGSKEIYLMDYDGWGQRRISAHRSISMAPSWEPDGGGLAYLSYFSGLPGLYTVDLANGAKTPLLVDDHHNFSPSFSPDGGRIAFGRSLSGNTEIFLADRRGGGLKRITNSSAIDTNPAWSPDGRRIAFTSSRAGNPHLYVMDVDGSNLRRMTFDGNYNDGAAWHPDGSRVAYASRRQGIFQIAITDLVTLETRLITTGSSNKEEPTWSPDGRHVAFTARRGNDTQIYVVDADGSHLRQVTREANNSSPAWSPYPAKAGK